MAHFLLIHGSCHGAWCWRDVLPALTALGHSAEAIDLPSHGDDPTPIADVTLAHYGRKIRAAIDAQSQPTIVVGHSAAGYAISLAADMDPTNIAHLVYLCAYVPMGGQTMIEMRRAGPYQTLTGAVIKSHDGLSYTFAPDRVPDLFYSDCPPETQTYAQRHLGPQPIAPQNTPLALGANYASVNRHYIRGANDGVIPPEYQTTMTAQWPQKDVESMACGHSPFFSDPIELAQRLDKIAAK